MNKPSLVVKIVIAVGITLIVGFSSGLVTAGAIENWYVDITKPSFNPPNWVFGPVWTVLYIAMGVAAALVWDKGWDLFSVKRGLWMFIIQLALNGLWTLVFFGLKSPPFAFAVIVLLWIFILLTMIEFFRIRKLAGWLMVPYIIWVSFAAVLNLSIWILN